MRAFVDVEQSYFQPCSWAAPWPKLCISKGFVLLEASAGCSSGGWAEGAPGDEGDPGRLEFGMEVTPPQSLCT